MNAKNSVKPRFSMDGVIRNKAGFNTALTLRPLDDAAMRSFGFTDHVPDRWFFCRRVSADGDITLNVIIGKTDDVRRIDVLDECFGQPYDYQAILNNNPDFEYANEVADKCEEWFNKLSEAGILDGWKPGMYV